MRYVFWQNCLSMHQLPFVARLMDCEGVESVTFVAGTDVDAERKAMGWSVPRIPGLERCQVVLNPAEEEMERLFTAAPDTTVHLFSGIRGFAFVYKAFLMSLRYDLERGLIVERPNTFAYGKANGKPLWMHRLKFWLQDARYRRHIRYVFAMGDDAVSYYQGLCREWRVFPFAYCTEPHPAVADRGADTAASTMLNCLFVGSLTCRKSVSSILSSYMLLPPSALQRIHLRVVGDGPEREMLEQKVKASGLSDNVEFAGTVPNDRIGDELAQSDVLILPSVYDGWGAVINEALGSGCLAIASDKCGARELLRDKRCGGVFRAGHPDELAALLAGYASDIAAVRRNRQWRQQWAGRNISGLALARYMTDCLNGLDPVRPWFRPQD